MYAGSCGHCESSDLFNTAVFCYVTEAEALPVGRPCAAPVNDKETQERDTALPSGRFISMVTGL